MKIDQWIAKKDENTSHTQNVEEKACFILGKTRLREEIDLKIAGSLKMAK